MSAVIITGISGAGKSTIAAVLTRRGLASIDADDDPLLSRMVDRAGAVVEEPAAFVQGIIVILQCLRHLLFELQAVSKLSNGLDGPPVAARQFAARMGATTVEVPTNHVAMVSHPDEVVQLIKTAAVAVAA